MRLPRMHRLADRMILRPTTFPVPADNKRRHTIPVVGQQVEVWVHDVGPSQPHVDLCILKFPGTGGRAEGSTDQPACFWPHLRTQIWAVNPPGYGGSTGDARLEYLAPTAQAVYDDLRSRLPHCPMLVMGNSLGGVSSLHLALTRSPDGLVLRNVPPLRQLIRRRYALRGLVFGSWLIASHVPIELDAIANARRATMGCVFVMSDRDRVVPPPYQRRLHAAYAGPYQVVTLAGGGHASSMSDFEMAQYRHALGGWLATVGLAHDLTAAEPCE